MSLVGDVPEVLARRALLGGAALGVALGIALLSGVGAEEGAPEQADAEPVPPPTAVLAAPSRETMPPVATAPSTPPLPTGGLEADVAAWEAPWHPEPPPLASLHKQPRPLTASERAGRMHREALERAAHGDASGASDLLRAALQVDPAHEAARRTLASLLVRDGQVDEALSIAEQGLERDPSQFALAKLAARVLVDRGEVAAALARLEVAPPPLHADPEYHAFRAALHQRAGDHERASGLYRQVLRRQPRQGLWWLGLGISLEARGRPADAARAYRNALAVQALDAASRGWVDARLRALQEAP